MNFISEKEINQNKNNDKNSPNKEPVDNRSLYYRLKEVRDKKQLEYEESHKLQNQFRGIDQDESDFLEMINNSKNEAEKQKKLEEAELIKQTLKMQSTISNESSIIPIKPIKNEKTTKQLSKQSLLISTGIRKRKQTNENFEETKINTNDKNNLLENNIELNKPKNFVNQSLCNLIGVLPSLVNYNDSSSNDDSDNSSDSTSSIECHKILYFEKDSRKSLEETVSNNKSP